MTLDDAFLKEHYADNKNKWLDPVSAAVLAIDKYFHEILEPRDGPGGLLPFGDFAFGVKGFAYDMRSALDYRSGMTSVFVLAKDFGSYNEAVISFRDRLHGTSGYWEPFLPEKDYQYVMNSLITLSHGEKVSAGTLAEIAQGLNVRLRESAIAEEEIANINDMLHPYLDPKKEYSPNDYGYFTGLVEAVNERSAQKIVRLWQSRQVIQNSLITSGFSAAAKAFIGLIGEKNDA
jgi:hypothetical protein